MKKREIECISTDQLVTDPLHEVACLSTETIACKGIWKKWASWFCNCCNCTVRFCAHLGLISKQKQFFIVRIPCLWASNHIRLGQSSDQFTNCLPFLFSLCTWGRNLINTLLIVYDTSFLTIICLIGIY